MNSQGITYDVPIWAFVGLVFLPLVAGVFAEILIYLKDYRNKNY